MPAADSAKEASKPADSPKKNLVKHAAAKIELDDPDPDNQQ